MQAQTDGFAFARANGPAPFGATADVDTSHDLEVCPCTTSLRLLVAAGFSIAKISAEQCRGHKTIVLTPTPALLRQLHSIRDLARCAENDRIVIRSEGLAADFATLLRACRDAHAAGTPRTALQQEDERGARAALEASPYKRHKIAARRSLCCNAG